MRGARDRARWGEQNPDGGDPVFLSAHRASAHADHIRRQSAANVARRLKTAIRGANRKLAELGIESISERVTTHSLRRTYASIRAASGDDPVYIAEQLGRTDSGHHSLLHEGRQAPREALRRVSCRVRASARVGDPSR
jgi:integrase